MGRSGSGKTTLLRAILPTYRRVLFLDPKRRNDFGGWALVEGERDARREWPRHTERIIARPALLERERDWSELLCRHAYYVAGCTVALDELPQGTTANIGLPWLETLLRRGREALITTYVATQRPKDIPLEILSEAEHVFAFALNLRADRDRVREVIGDYQEPSIEHGFVYWQPGLTRAVDCLPL